LAIRSEAALWSGDSFTDVIPQFQLHARKRGALRVETRASGIEAFACLAAGERETCASLQAFPNSESREGRFRLNGYIHAMGLCFQ